MRLRHAYVLKAEEVVHNEQGDILEIHCAIDMGTLGKNPEGRKVKGVIHWVSAADAHPITVYEYDRLFTDPNPARDDDFLQFLNPNSLEEKQAMAEPALAHAAADDVFQFERLGYYAVNKKHGQNVEAYHRIVNLKDTWSGS